MKIKYHRKRFNPLSEIAVGTIVVNSNLSKVFLVTDNRDDHKIELIDVETGNVLWTDVNVKMYECKKDVLFGNSDGVFTKEIPYYELKMCYGCLLGNYKYNRSAYIYAKDDKFFDLWSGKQTPRDEVIVRNVVVVYTEGSLEVTI